MTEAYFDMSSMKQTEPLNDRTIAEQAQRTTQLSSRFKRAGLKLLSIGCVGLAASAIATLMLDERVVQQSTTPYGVILVLTMSTPLWSTLTGAGVIYYGFAERIASYLIHEISLGE